MNRLWNYSTNNKGKHINAFMDQYWLWNRRICNEYLSIREETLKTKEIKDMRKMYLKISIPLYGCWVGSFTSMSIITIEMNLNELIQKQEQSREIHDYNNEMTDNSIIFMIIRGKWKWSFLYPNSSSMIISFFSFIT